MRDISDKELIVKLESICLREREILSEVLLHLAEVDNRKLYLELGHGSLFSFCVSGLRYSEPQAQRRISAARCAAKFPEIIELLIAKRINLTTVSLISSVLTSANKDELLALIADKPTRDVESILAGLKPEKVVRESIKAIPAAPVLSLLVNDANKGELSFCSAKQSTKVEAPNLRHEGESKRPELQEVRYEVKFSVGKKVLDKLNRVKALSKKGYNLEALFESLLDMKLDALKPKRNARATPASGRAVPKAIKHEISERDGQRCAFVSSEGKRCQESVALQFDHVKPVAKGGSSTADNLRLLCSGHNLFEAKREFGEDFIEGFY